MGHSSTHTICGCGISIPPHASPVRKRHQLELALMGRGDIVNGTIVFGMAPSLAVIARTTVRRQHSGGWSGSCLNYILLNRFD